MQRKQRRGRMLSTLPSRRELSLYGSLVMSSLPIDDNRIIRTGLNSFSTIGQEEPKKNMNTHYQFLFHSSSELGFFDVKSSV
jgi:hypothetical protein